MRIRYLLPAPGIPLRGPSGASAHARGLTVALARAHAVDVVAARLADHRGVYGEPPPPAVEVGVGGWPAWLDQWRDAREIRTARRIARRVIDDARAGDVPDLVIERHSLFSDAGWRVHDTLGVPWVLEVNAPPCRERRRFERLRRPRLAAEWERAVLRAAPLVVCVSTWLRRWLVEDLGCRRVVRIPNGVTPRRGNRELGRARLGLDPDEPVIGFVGSMKPWHGVGRLGAVARRVGARLVLIGEQRPPERFLQPGEHLPENVLWTGHLASQGLADAVAALDVGLVPYREDAPPWFCPLKVLDYRAQGTPVVGTDVGDTAALTGTGGTIVPPDDDDALVEATQAWLGRRVAPHVRSWRQVGEEILAAASKASDG
ncbi:MAG: glycosyltransferase [Deltaproteobacteria bacterium]|nr:MAG: glycosyltransferase [Deltaproteobacteria bacterium]